MYLLARQLNLLTLSIPIVSLEHTLRTHKVRSSNRLTRNKNNPNFDFELADVLVDNDFEMRKNEKSNPGLQNGEI